MNTLSPQLTLNQWKNRYCYLRGNGMVERFYGGPLQRHFDAGDKRLGRLQFDNSPAALALWNIGLSPWDMAAGALIVLEAGGLVTDLAGNQNYLESGNILAGNPKIHAEMLAPHPAGSDGRFAALSKTC